MATSSFKDLMKVCEALGLRQKTTTSGIMYTGMANGKYCRISIHKHAGGRDIPTGTFNAYVKELGFHDAKDYFKFLNQENSLRS